MQSEQCDVAKKDRVDFVKDALEAISARARYLRNWRLFYKWSIAAGLVGVLGGMGALLFSYTLDTITPMFDWAATALPDPRLIAIIPAFGGLLVGLMRHFWMPEAFCSPCATDAMIDIIHEEGGRAKAKVPFVTILTASITLASGGSAGRECPTALIGTGLGSIASSIIEKLRLDKLLGFSFTKEDVRVLAVCGAAAGLGAVFRAPIGSALFAASVLYIYGMEYDLLLPSMISSATSYLIFSTFYGFEPLFNAPFIWEFNVFDLGVMLFIGVLASLVGILYLKVFYGVFRYFRGMALPDWVKPALGGLLMGILVLFVPRVWGMGYGTIQDIIDLQLALPLLLLLVIAKILASSLSIGSGGAGGVIAPSLFIGAALGGAVGTLAMHMFPGAEAHPTLYVIAGMGALYASVGKVPLSTAIILCETTRNFTMIIPLVVANTAGFLASGTSTIYESQHADATRETADILRHVQVEQVMTKAPSVLRDDTSVQDVLRIVGTSGHHGFPVVNAENHLVGVVSWTDARALPYEDRAETPISEIMTKELTWLRPTDSARAALDMIERNDIGRVIIA
ncbi:MAG: chloride channel protein, partial [Coriobacteriia bacterium]|nr:chloride channel protein [Coriobacteriia bacterium]